MSVSKSNSSSPRYSPMLMTPDCPHCSHNHSPKVEPGKKSDGNQTPRRRKLPERQCNSKNCFSVKGTRVSINNVPRRLSLQMPPQAETCKHRKGQTAPNHKHPYLRPDFENRSSGDREVDPREVMARMDSPIVKTVLKMDIPKLLVEEAIKKQLSGNGKDFSSSESLLEAVFSLNLQEEMAGKSVSDVAGKAEKEQKSHKETPKNTEDSDRLKEENRLLKEQRQCKICMDEEVCMAFLPCGHLVCCSTCAPALDVCPICRAKVRGTVRTYLS